MKNNQGYIFISHYATFSLVSKKFGSLLQLIDTGMHWTCLEMVFFHKKKINIIPLLQQQSTPLPSWQNATSKIHLENKDGWWEPVVSPYKIQAEVYAPTSKYPKIRSSHKY